MLRRRREGCPWRSEVLHFMSSVPQKGVSENPPSRSRWRSCYQRRGVVVSSWMPILPEVRWRMGSSCARQSFRPRRQGGWTSRPDLMGSSGPGKRVCCQISLGCPVAKLGCRWRLVQPPGRKRSATERIPQDFLEPGPDVHRFVNGEIAYQISETQRRESRRHFRRGHIPEYLFYLSIDPPSPRPHWNARDGPPVE